MVWPRFASKGSCGPRVSIARVLLALGLLLGAAPGSQAHPRNAITIITQPADQVVDAGQRATFTVVAKAERGRLRYQWFCTRLPALPGRGRAERIHGATAPSYTTPVLGTAQNGKLYFVRLVDPKDREESRKALLTVRSFPPPTRPVVHLAPYVTGGATGLKASTPFQGPGVVYSWTLQGGTLTVGQGTPAITFTAGTAGTLLTATVRVTNPHGSASGSATAKVVPAPSAELALPLSVHPGDGWMKASVPIQSGMTYLWTILPGTSDARIMFGQGTGVIGFSSSGAPGTFELQASVRNLAGDSATAARTVAVARGTWLVENGGSSVPRTGATATRLPSGRILVAGGGSPSAEIYDPATGTWTLTGSLGAARGSHTATLLRSGMVLVAGGVGDPGVALASAELYDPAKGTWTPTGSLATARTDHTATPLPDGTVLVAGGDAAYDSHAFSSAEIYDPARGTWAPAAPMGAARQAHTATLLPGGLVLVAGGQDALYGFLSSTEIYHSSTGTWTPTGSLGTARCSHSATLLPDGTVLAAGGGVFSGGGTLASAERYDPGTGTWTATGSLGTARGGQTATLLADGKVLVAGGQVPDYQGLASSEIYDPAQGTWAATGSLEQARHLHAAALLPDGTVLVAGGGFAKAEIFNPSDGTWSPMGGLGTACAGHTATLLPDTTVLVAGGDGTRAEIYHPADRTWSPTGSLGRARTPGPTATLLRDGKVLVAGGFGGGASAELYDPAQGTWTPAASMNAARRGHSASLLPDGTVLVAGGYAVIGETVTLSSAEIYDPAKGTWTLTGTLGAGRGRHTATLLPNGTVLVAGGAYVHDASTPLASAEVFDPVMGTWSATASLGTARAGHTATLLPDGTVLVAGGDKAYNPLGLDQAELYNPAHGTWAATASLGTARTNHTATLLPDGTVLVTGGRGQVPQAPASAEIFSPGKGTWTPTGSLETGRSLHTATLLGDGTVLVAFGSGGDVVTEIYVP